MAITRAYVNHGRWICECECRGASVCRPGQRLYRCQDCGCQWDIIWPDVPGIAAVLARRPDVTKQNWWPGESVADLVAENVEHGVPIPTPIEGLS